MPKKRSPADPGDLKKDQAFLKEYLLRMRREAIEPIKAMVRSGEIDYATAVSMIGQALGQFSDAEYKPEYKRFRENMKEIFKNETYFESGYQTSTAIGFRYREPSHVDAHFLFKLHEHLKGEPYRTPQELKAAAAKLLKGKRLLEIGCGPGFGLKLFKDLGAKASGVEIREDYKGRIKGLGIKYGDAEDIGALFDGEKFDIVYSCDFFADVVIARERADKIIRAVADHTAPGGYNFHLITCEQMHPALHEFGCWMTAVRNGQNEEEWQKWYDNVPEDTKEDALWTNKATLDPQYLARAGFKITEYGIEDGDLIVVARKN